MKKQPLTGDKLEVLLRVGLYQEAFAGKYFSKLVAGNYFFLFSLLIRVIANTASDIPTASNPNPYHCSSPKIIPANSITKDKPANGDNCRFLADVFKIKTTRAMAASMINAT